MKGNIDSKQLGFGPGHSSVHYLIELSDTFLKHLEKNEAYVDALFVDIVQAFDSLDHNVVVE